MIRRRRPRRAFAMALMLVVLMVLTVITATLVGTGVRDQQSARLAAGRNEARLLASSVLEDFFSRLRAEPTAVFDLLASASGDRCPAESGLQASPPCGVPSVFDGYDAAYRRDGQPARWALLPSLGRSGTIAASGPVGSTPCREDLTEDCFHVQVEDPLGRASAPGSFVLRVNLRLRCGGVEARCVYSSFEQRVRRVQFYDFALAQEYTTLAPEALFPPGSFDAVGDDNFAAYEAYSGRCADVRAPQRAAVRFAPPLAAKSGVDSGSSWATGEFVHDGLDLPVEGCLDIAYQADSGGSGDDLAGASVYSLDDYLTVCGNGSGPEFSSVFLSGEGFSGGPFENLPGCGATPDPVVRELRVPAMRLPEESDVLAAARAVDASRVELVKSAAYPIEITFNGAGWSATGASGTASGTFDAARGTVLVVDGSNPSPVGPGWSDQGSVDVLVKGTVDGRVSLVVKGSVAVVDDVTYAAPCAKGNFICLGSTANDDALSITASERIEIWQSCPLYLPDPDPVTVANCVPAGDLPAGSTKKNPGDRVVHAVLTSPQGFVGVPDWSTNFDVPDAPEPQDRIQGTLVLFGGIASKYQGVFGGFAQGELLSGFFKRFGHDDRFTRAARSAAGADVLPPYLVESTIPVWVRLDLSEVGYRGE